jgi:hypothetical protein
MIRSFGIGEKVKKVVPYGVNAGQLCGYGVVVFSMNSSMDGVVYDVLMNDGTIERETAESWLRKA